MEIDVLQKVKYYRKKFHNNNNKNNNDTFIMKYISLSRLTEKSKFVEPTKDILLPPSKALIHFNYSHSFPLLADDFDKLVMPPGLSTVM